MKRTIMGVAGVVVLVAAIAWSSIQPSSDRNWIAEHSLSPIVRLDQDSVVLQHVRNFRRGPGSDVRRSWETRRYSLQDVRTVWYVLTPFSSQWRGPAHAFLSFGFANGEHLAISIEARREVGEEYSILRGLLKRFELIYVIGDERDLIDARVRSGDQVYVYPTRATPAQARVVLVEMLERAATLREQPEFYGSLFNNCTTNLLAHVNRVASRPIRYGGKILLPGYSDQLALEHGLIDTTLPLDSVRARFLVNERALRFAGAVDYSRRIRPPRD